MSRDFDGYDTYMTKLTQAKSDIDALYAEIEAINTDIQGQIVPMTDPGLGEKSTVDRLVKRYKALSDHDKELIQNWDAVLAVKAQTDAAQRNLFLIIGGAVVIMVAATVVIRRRRESK
jgi:LPXTG-motif cell wall-anchored protein